MNGLEELARRALDLFLGHLILCEETALEWDDVGFWSLAYLDQAECGTPGSELARRALDMTCEIMAYQRAEERMRSSRAGNPANVVAVLIYNISHSGHFSRWKQIAWAQRIRRGFRLTQVRSPAQAAALIPQLRGAHLSERAVGELLGWSVNLDRAACYVEEEYCALCKEVAHL